MSGGGILPKTAHPTVAAPRVSEAALRKGAAFRFWRVAA